MDEFYSPGETSLDPDEMDGLKLGHITTREELNRFEQDNINEAFQWISNRRKQDILTEKFVKTLHQKMFGKVWRWAGSFRRSGKNIGVDWVSISSELHKLFDDVRYWIKNDVYDSCEIAVRFHHRLVWIHAFPNGNGRHGRLMADILCEEVLGVELFGWGSKYQKLSEDEIREKYLQALRSADRGDYSLLIDFVR